MEFLVATLETERKHRNASQLPRENNLQPRIQHPGKPPIKSEDRLKTLSVMQLCPTLISSEFCLRKALEGLFLHREGVNRVNGAVGCWIQGLSDAREATGGPRTTAAHRPGCQPAQTQARGGGAGSTRKTVPSTGHFAAEGPWNKGGPCWVHREKSRQSN